MNAKLDTSLVQVRDSEPYVHLPHGKSSSQETKKKYRLNLNNKGIFDIIKIFFALLKALEGSKYFLKKNFSLPFFPLKLLMWLNFFLVLLQSKQFHNFKNMQIGP